LLRLDPRQSENEEITLQRHAYASTFANAPFAGVHALLRETPERLFRDPGHDSGEPVTSRELEVHAGLVPIHDRFTIEFGEFESYPQDHFCRLRLKCHGDRHHMVLPDVDIAVEASDAGDQQTELEIVGHYSPRLGALGALEDALVGHHAVEEAMTVLVADFRAALEAAHSRAHAPATVAPATAHTAHTDDDDEVAEGEALAS
jgi:hypothetical protein